MQVERKSERVKSFLRAQISFNQAMSTFDCIIKNISPHGARIAIDELLAIPGEFDLHIPQKSKTYRAKMVWRQADAMGVAFLLDGAQSSKVENAFSSDLRVRELETQNAELRSKIRDLTKRLQDLGQDPEIAA